MSTFWPCPLASRAKWANRLAVAASAPACKPAWGRLICTGGRPGSPVRNSIPPDAQLVISAAAQPAPGPRSPNGVILQ